MLVKVWGKFRVNFAKVTGWHLQSKANFKFSSVRHSLSVSCSLCRSLSLSLSHSLCLCCSLSLSLSPSLFLTHSLSVSLSHSDSLTPSLSHSLCVSLSLSLSLSLALPSQSELVTIKHAARWFRDSFGKVPWCIRLCIR